VLGSLKIALGVERLDVDALGRFQMSVSDEARSSFSASACQSPKLFFVIAFLSHSSFAGR
jgi:hypothetical protein